MNFAAPQLLWLVLLAPAGAAAAALLWRRRLAADAAWAARGLWSRLRGPLRTGQLAAGVVGLSLAVLGISLALARPRWGTSHEQVERQGVDIVFVLDTSLSMAAYDVKPSRFWVAQSLIRRLVQELPGNRVALVQAEGEGVIMSPLTVDAAVIDLLLDAAEPGSLPTPGTRLAPALERALELFPAGGEKHRAIVLLSDGEDHEGSLRAVAAKLREAGVVVHAIGVGTPEGAPVPIPGGAHEFKRDQRGQVVVSQLHRETLESLARATGGDYLPASSANTDPGPLATRIAAMQKRQLDSESLSTMAERFQWPLALAAAAIALALLTSPFAPFARSPEAA